MSSQGHTAENDALTVTIFGRPVEVPRRRLEEARTTITLLLCVEGLTAHEARALDRVHALLARVTPPEAGCA